MKFRRKTGRAGIKSRSNFRYLTENTTEKRLKIEKIRFKVPFVNGNLKVLKDMEYKFLGNETAKDVKPLADCEYKVDSLKALFDVLNDGIWRIETCTPRLRGDWTDENKTLGQCSVTAFLVQDIFGGGF